ncbi:hypothetical protein GCM10010251_22240 [Streptomyces aurantiogriseus]|uniref:Uncharacterized protein n=1 Tax=Streptomyces aurantiogriseus TaxID=66870 RepID=A0A918C5P6_9ACTN|nr:hypothetical protein GCM10010251_22240 [Streptomyces aurantiogriseus]
MGHVLADRLPLLALKQASRGSDQRCEDAFLIAGPAVRVDGRAQLLQVRVPHALRRIRQDPPGPACSALGPWRPERELVVYLVAVRWVPKKSVSLAMAGVTYSSLS